MSSEFSTLLADVKEQILYLQELGVEDFAVELPEISFVQESKIQNAEPKISQQRLERFVPDEAILKKVAEPAPKTSEPKTERRSLLESTKLSRLPSLPKRTITNLSFPTKNQEQAKGETMPKQKTTAAENQAQSLFGETAQTLPESNETIEEIRADIGNCTRCPLWEGRTKIVHSEGNLSAELVFVGEAPGANEDAEGRPFVGRAGQLLNKIIEAIGMKREDVFIGNINRCRPPGNRTPTLPEAHTCRPFLTREIAVIRPKVIVVLGNTATQNLLDTKVGITKLRGEFQDYYGVKVMPTFHPAYLLRDPSKKRETWEDMKKVRDYMNSVK
ncbi:MAG TPA: uracil-DNA glycosylase [Pyrinomonadaceae bacterium]|jgi:DNA polymerase